MVEISEIEVLFPNNPNKDTESEVYRLNFMSHVQAGFQNDFQLQ